MTVDNDTDRMKIDDKIGPGELKKKTTYKFHFFYTYSKKKQRKK